MISGRINHHYSRRAIFARRYQNLLVHNVRENAIFEALQSQGNYQKMLKIFALSSVAPSNQNMMFARRKVNISLISVSLPLNKLMMLFTPGPPPDWNFGLEEQTAPDG